MKAPEKITDSDLNVYIREDIHERVLKENHKLRNQAQVLSLKLESVLEDIAIQDWPY
jgi:hypothetical protein